MTFADKMSIWGLVISALNLLVLAGTGFVVWLYTKESQKSNEIQEKPFLSLSYKETSMPGTARLGLINLKNIGKGIAYSISIEPIELQKYKYCFYVKNPSLESSQEVQPRNTARTPTGATQGNDDNLMWFLSRLVSNKLTHEAISQHRDNPAIFLLVYQGANGKIYHSTFAFYCNLPPVGDMVMQFLDHGVGESSADMAMEIYKKAKKINSPFSR